MCYLPFISTVQSYFGSIIWNLEEIRVASTFLSNTSVLLFLSFFPFFILPYFLWNVSNFFFLLFLDALFPPRQVVYLILLHGCTLRSPFAIILEIPSPSLISACFYGAPFSVLDLQPQLVLYSKANRFACWADFLWRRGACSLESAPLPCFLGLPTLITPSPHFTTLLLFIRLGDLKIYCHTWLEFLRFILHLWLIITIIGSNT